MVDIGARIAIGAEWLAQNLAFDGPDQAGWGWVADVPPNPQNTAEVVCTLVRLGVSVPETAAVANLLRKDVIAFSNRGNWAFREPLDVAWRLRALRCLDLPGDDDDVRRCTDALLVGQDSDTGGWRMAGRAGSVSVTATAAGLQALIAVGTDEVAAPASRAARFLVNSVLDDDVRTEPAYAAAMIGIVLSRPEVIAIGGKRVQRARERAVDRVLDHLRRGGMAVEEEVFLRGERLDTWRHLSLHLAVAALASSDEESMVVHPAFRRALADLLELQEGDSSRVNWGGFRTSGEGFVTSFATTQALDALDQVRRFVDTRVSPATVFDMICTKDGSHHSDPQIVARIDNRRFVLNSYAGADVLTIGSTGGVSTIVLALLFNAELGEAASRGLVILGTLLMYAGTYALVATLTPTIPKGRIAAAVFAAFTALVLPIVTFVVT